MFDVNSVRQICPALAGQVHGRPLIYLDNAATAQMPQPVWDAVRRIELRRANVHRGIHAVSEECTSAYEAARTAVAAYLGAQPEQIRFTSGDAENNPRIAWRGGVFPTPHQRFAFYLETPTPRAVTTKTPTAEEIDRERIPHFFPPAEGWSENAKTADYPIILMSERPRYRVHSQWATVPLLREIDPEPIVKMNPADCVARGIADRSYVECYNDRGHAVAKVLYSEAVRPGHAVYPKGWPISAHKAGSWSELSSTDFDVWTVNYNFMDVLCEVRPWNEGGVQ